MIETRKRNQGFTLIELMIAMFLSTMVIGGIFALFRNQVAIHNTERLVLSMQQNARAAVSFMERDIRLAGSDPAGTSGASFLSANEVQLQFQTDADEDGLIGAGETVTYSLSGTNLMRTTDTSALVARNIEALNFDYFDSFGANISDKSVDPYVVPASSISAIARVEISIVARSGDAIPGLFIKRLDSMQYRNLAGNVILDKSGPNADFFRRMQVTTNIDCRNVAN
jgi:type IV pilus assembly protein PilW